MIFLWTINEHDEIELNVSEILKDDVLAPIYRNDKTPGKFIAREYFRYLDFMTNSSGYCKRNGLSFKDSHIYSLKQVKLPQDFVFDKNNKKIIDYIEDNIECDIVVDAIRTSIKGLKFNTKNIEAYIEYLNDVRSGDFKDKDGNIIDISTTITKLLTAISNVPKDIEKLNKLMDEQKQNKHNLRGSGEYEQSMDGDEDNDTLGINYDEEEPD